MRNRTLIPWLGFLQGKEKFLRRKEIMNSQCHK
jgi:hypothetical protein